MDCAAALRRSGMTPPLADSAGAGIKRDWDALDAVELAPRYGKVIAPPPADTILFGRSFAAPRSGIDAARVIACGADAAFAGKSFLWSLGALGDRGPAHLINVYIDDLRATLGQLGCKRQVRTTAISTSGFIRDHGVRRS